ncbi:MarR family transcriptional regulator [Streptacidiphilus sp. ASG 303]|uniref:MarR family winged helix-turn-helix transcriptional regulator n=1 Tax=Streptacidiphilus sp. ASG 303 TaxID=2896847 RepID=UPI0027E1441E|nr:MarR family transcriptional regulator [Streptacidiphilus sp. ASG 303]
MTEPAPSPLPPGLEDSLGWLLARCSRAHVEAVQHAVADLPHGLRGFQALSGAAHRSVRNQAELARQLGVDRTVMVYLLDDLEEAGLVERVAEPSDRRSKLVRATPEGRRRLSAAQAVIDGAEAALLEPLSPSDRDRLPVILRAIAAHHVSPEGPDGVCAMAQGAAGSAGTR